MSAGTHRSEAGETPVDVHVRIVSSSRTTATDRSGAALGEMLIAAGHHEASREVVDDDVDAIRDAVRSLAASGAAVVILTGGTGVTGRDVTPQAMQSLFEIELPGFGELFRMLSFQEIGPAAMLSRACSGLVRSTVVYALPGSEAACRLAMNRLILPELRHVVHLAHKERAAGGTSGPSAAASIARPTATPPTAAAPVNDTAVDPTVDKPALPGAVTVSSIGAGDAPLADAEEGAWQRSVTRVKGTIDRLHREDLPVELERFAPLINVLEQAGETAVLEVAGGHRYSLWGFPDLRRPGSKVLAIGPGSPLGEIVALHRGPVLTGTCISERAGLCGARDSDVQALSRERLGRAPPEPVGPLFAVASDAIWFEREGKVVRWDGHRERVEGTPKQAIASLALDWSQR